MTISWDEKYEMSGGLQRPSDLLRKAAARGCDLVLWCDAERRVDGRVDRKERHVGDRLARKAVVG
jgi:hypothetical protein